MEATNHEEAEGGDDCNFSHLASYFLAIFNIPQVIGHHFAFFFFFFFVKEYSQIHVTSSFLLCLLLLNNKDRFGR